MKTAIVPVLAFGMVAQASALDWNTLRNNTVTGNLNDGVAAIGYTLPPRPPGSSMVRSSRRALAAR